MDEAREARDEDPARMDQLLASLYLALPELERLLDRADRCPDNDVRAMADLVDSIVHALENTAPGRRLSPAGLELMRPSRRARGGETRQAEGTGEHLVHPAVQGFRQARFFLELAILCGRAGQALPRDLSDAATVLGRLFCLDQQQQQQTASDGPRPPRARGTTPSTARG
jgi:hypothetical protein